MVNSVAKVRGEFDNLLDITAQTPSGIVPVKKLQTNLRELMGDRVKQYIGTTYKIFQNSDYSFYSRYKPTDQAVNKVKEIFKRYAAKNKNPISDEEAEQLVNNILRQAKAVSPKEKLPSFNYENLTIGAKTPENVKTFARTLEKELPDGTKELRVIGRGSKAFRELFGEIEDARYSIFEGMNKLGTIARKNQLFDEILDTDEAMKAAAKTDTLPGQRGFFFESPMMARRAMHNNDIVKIDDYVGEYFKDGVLINRLKGLYTTKDIAEAFSSAGRVSNFMQKEAKTKFGEYASWAWRNLFLTPKAGSQFAKTVLSPPTHFRNFFSSAGFSLANGTLFTDPVTLGKALNKARRLVQVGVRAPKAMEEYRELLELGITNSNVRMGDLKNLMKDAKIFESGIVATDSVLKPMMNALGKVGENAVRGARKTAQVMQDAYVAEDDFWKITNFYIENERLAAAYAKKGIKKSAEAIKQEAADVVRNTIPNYAYVGEFVRGMRATPFGNFMSWPSEVYRTGTNIITRALKEIKDPVTGKINPITSTNPLKGIGMKRLIGGITAFGALPYGLVKGVQAINGVSDEEADAGRDFVAPWSKNSQLIFTRDPETGELYYTDWSKNNVYDTLTRPFQSVLANIQQGIEDEEILLKGFMEGIAKAAGETASPFISESIFTEAFADIFLRGGRTREGQELYNENTPEGEKIRITLEHIIKTLKPTIAPFERTVKAIKGEPGKGPTVYEVPYELAGIFGFRLEKVDPKKALGFYLYDLRTGESDATKLFTGGKYGVLSGEPKTPKDVIERYFIANKTLFDVRKQMLTHIRNAMRLGVNPKQLEDIFEKRGIPKSKLDELLSGQFKPFFPSEKIEERFQDISIEGGQPNPLLVAQGSMRAIEGALKGQNLYGDFQLELENFMPDTDPQGQSALPEQVMPSQEVIQTATVQAPGAMNQGLTATENALLSEEEKQIRLRSRGLA